MINAVWSLPKYRLLDSTSVTTQKKDSAKDHFSSTIRLNSLGYFGYGGRLVSDYQSFDANLIYERKGWGALLFKVVDLYDSESPNNFAMAMAYKKIAIGQRFTFTPYAGFIIEQLEGIADKDSDLGIIAISKFKLSKYLSIDHSGVLSNLVLAPEHKDWTNRFRLMFDSGHYNLTWLGWLNNNVLDETNYYSSGISASYNKIEISENISMNAGITAFKMLHTSSDEVRSKKDGLLMTLALNIN